MRLIRLVSLLFSSGILLFASENSSLLSALKQDTLKIDRQKNELESDNLKYDWVKQVSASYSYSHSDQFDTISKTRLFSLTFNQPIFKSGGIFYGIEYSGANREFLRLSTKLNEQTLIKNVISSWLSIKKLDLQIKRQEYLIQNAKIDVIRKKEQYEAGILDSSFLDNSILVKSTFEKALVDMQSARYTQLMAFKSLSDSNYKNIQPPKFFLLKKSKYLDKSLSIKQQLISTKKAQYLKKMTVANYYPTVSLFGGYYSSSIEKKNILHDDYFNVGLKISMPIIDINRGRTIELRQLDILKSKLALEDTKQSEAKLFDDYVKRVEFLKKKINISSNDAKLYDSLLTSTLDSYESGEKTIYDVDTLKNSKQTMILDKQMFEIDVQKSLLELYAKMNGAI